MFTEKLEFNIDNVQLSDRSPALDIEGQHKVLVRDVIFNLTEMSKQYIFKVEFSLLDEIKQKKEKATSYGVAYFTPDKHGYGIKDITKFFFLSLGVDPKAKDAQEKVLEKLQSLVPANAFKKPNPGLTDYLNFFVQNEIFKGLSFLVDVKKAVKKDSNGRILYEVKNKHDEQVYNYSWAIADKDYNDKCIMENLKEAGLA